MKSNHRLAVVGLFLLLPAGILIISGVLGFNVSPVLIHPVAVMGGLLVALLLNLKAILHLQAEREHGHIAAVTVRIGTKPLNLAILVMGVVLLATILCYAFVENFRPR